MNILRAFFCLCAVLFSDYFMCNAQNGNTEVGMYDLHEAAKRGNEKSVEELLRNGVKVDAENGNKQTALHKASEKGRRKVVELLLSNGANVNAQDDNKETPLHLAAAFGREKVVEILLENGANINAEQIEKQTPLHEASFKPGNEKVVGLLLQKGANVNAVNILLNTPLHISAQNGHDKVAELLIQNGADINAENVDKKTPLHFSVQNSHEKVVELLLQNGANVNAADTNNSTSLLIGVEFGYENIIKILLAKGANVNIQNKDRRTPLHLAVQSSENIVRLLLDKSAFVDAENKDRSTPLHIAAFNESGAIVDLLIKDGALTNIKNIQGNTPKDLVKAGSPIYKLFDQTRPVIQACQKYRNLPTGYILGGTPVELGELPWMAALGYLDFESGYGINFKCGGTVISDRFVLTAAHCAKPGEAPVVVRLGKTTFNDTDNIKPVNIGIKNITRHPDYSSLTKKNDIALLRLKEMISFTDFISPACLQTYLRDENPNVDVIVAGWGKTSAEGSDRSNTLLKAKLKTMPLEECSDRFSTYNLILNLPAFREGLSASQYCAYDPDDTADSCQGDSGGPLQIFNKTNDGVATVVGIVSFGIDCGSQLPGIYTRVAYYLDWIESIVWPA